MMRALVAALACLAVSLAGCASQPSVLRQAGGGDGDVVAMAQLAPSLLRGDILASLGGSVVPDAPTDQAGLATAAKGVRSVKGPMTMDMAMEFRGERVTMRMEATMDMQVLEGDALLMSMGMRMSSPEVGEVVASDVRMELFCTPTTLWMSSDGLADKGAPELDLKVDNPLGSCASFVTGEVDAAKAAELRDELAGVLGGGMQPIVPELTFVDAERDGARVLATYTMSLDMGKATGGLGTDGAFDVEVKATLEEGRIVRMGMAGDGTLTLQDGAATFTIAATQDYAYGDPLPRPAKYAGL